MSTFSSFISALIQRENMSEKKEDPSNIHQTMPLLPSIISGLSGLDYLRMIDSLYVKQYPSLIEGNLFVKTCKFNI
jgi:hypothetical protein